MKSFDGKEIYTRLWDNVSQPKGVVQICHGLGEHSARYEPFAEFLNANGYIAFADDHRAHGYTDNGSGDCTGEPAVDTIQDLLFFSRWLHERYPDLPLVFFGHSYGSSGKCICGKVCPHEKHNTKGTCTLCGGSVSHRYVGGKCDCGMTQTVSCAHGRHGSDGICPDCGAGDVHRFVAGSCYCGVKEMPIPDTTAPTQPEVPTTTQPLPVTTEPVTEPTTQPVTTQPQATAAPETNPTTESETGTAPAQPVPPEPKPPVPFAAIGCTAAILAAVGVLIFMKIRKSKQS